MVQRQSSTLCKGSNQIKNQIKMRKITEKVVNAFHANETIKIDNTEVCRVAITLDNQFPKGDHWLVMELFGNQIARKDSATGIVEINNCGHPTNTTKERLNGLGASIYQKDFVWHHKDGKLFPNNQWVKL